MLTYMYSSGFYYFTISYSLALWCHKLQTLKEKLCHISFLLPELSVSKLKSVFCISKRLFHKKVSRLKMKYVPFRYIIITLMIQVHWLVEHLFWNCLLPCFVPYSYLGRPSSQWQVQLAVRDKTRYGKDQWILSIVCIFLTFWFYLNTYWRICSRWLFVANSYFEPV